MIAGPSEADPHRFSDAAALATPPTPAPMPNGYESNASPGAAGPAASDALYFVGHSGGHPGLAADRAGASEGRAARLRAATPRQFGTPLANPSIPIASSATSRSCDSRCMASR